MMARPLTNKQQRFVEEYLKDCNATQAAIRAGYSRASAKLSGHRCITNDTILRMILAKQKELASQCNVEAKEVIEECKKLAFANMADYITVDGYGKPEIDLSRMTRDQAAALSEVTNRSTTTKDGGSEHYGIKFHSKDGALEKLCKHLGLYKEPEAETKIELKIVMYGVDDGD